LGLGGALTLASIGTLHRSPATTGTVNLTGTLDLTGHTLAASAGPWTLAGGTIKGGTVGNTLIGTDTASTLQDVTLTGALNITAGNAPLVHVAGVGLTLQGGTVKLGDFASLIFSGNQALGGSGTVTISSSGT